MKETQNTSDARTLYGPTIAQRLAKISDRRARLKAELLTFEPTLRRIAELASPFPEKASDIAEEVLLRTPEEDERFNAAQEAQDFDTVGEIIESTLMRETEVYRFADVEGFADTIGLFIELLETARDGEPHYWERIARKSND